MEHSFYIISLLTAGISSTLGILSLIIGLIEKKEKEYLIFGIMSLCLAAFFLFPPLGFILNDEAPYPTQIEIKRIFIFGYYSFIPLFLIYYTRFKKLSFPYFIFALSLLCYILMIRTETDTKTPLWFTIALLVFLLTTIFGMWIGIWQRKKGNKRDAHFLLFAMAVFAVLFMLTFIHQFYNDAISESLKGKFFYPFHLNSVAFLIIMGIRLFEKAYERFKLEKLLNIRSARWNTFMKNAPLMVLELDENENILFINKHGLETLGCDSLADLKGKNWFDLFVAAQDRERLKRVFNKITIGSDISPFFKNSIKRMDGQERIISWINFLVSSEDTSSKVIMCAGKDVTEEERNNELVNKLKQEIEKENIVCIDTGDLAIDEVIGHGAGIQYVLQKIRVVAATQVPVLLEGETGVGKELVADLIYQNSLRLGKPFVKVNCGALPKDLIEDELFGHEKGAFTSAIQARKGRFELADGGTIFLDEIGELPLEMQPRLLRVLQDGQFERVGGQKTIKVDVRILAATNRNLESDIKNGRFREDLFYRLNVYPITIPPLRKRKEDLPELINYFISHYAKKYGRNLLQISKADMQRLVDHPWPGNVRELKNVLERSVLASQGPTLKLDWFFNVSETEELLPNRSLVKIEKEYIVKIMEECRWKINGENGAAEKLEMHPNTLRSKMKKLGILRPAF